MDKRELRTSIILFVLTFLTLTFKENLFIGILLGEWQIMWQIFLHEWYYSVFLILILFAHEMGHYLPARFYGLKATLPYFIPFPIGPIGTMGAVIRIKEPIPNKIQLFDVGVGGPVMSLVLSLPCWLYGLYLSELTPIQDSSNSNFIIFFGDSLFTYWTGQWILGPYDPNLYDIAIHPLAKAGWVGLVITAINLLPFGQLDGGHVIYALFGEKYRKWIYYGFIGFILLSLWNFTWLVWSFIIFYIIQIEHPYVPDHPYRNLDSNRKWLGYIMLISFVFIFVPQPLKLGIEMQKPSLIEDLIQFIFH